MSELPKGWANVAIGEINAYDSGNIDPLSKPKECFELYSVPIFPTRKPEIALGADIRSTKQKVEPDDILLCKINPRINRVWQVAAKGELKQIASSEWIIIRQPLMDSNFLRHQLCEQGFRERLCAEVSGVGGSLTRAQPKKVTTYKIVLPPLAEQTRIAQKLDELLAQVDTLKARLDAIPALLKRFRQSTLAAAVSGRLTADWRAEFNSSIESGPELLLKLFEQKESWLKANPDHNEAGRVRKRVSAPKSSMLDNGELPDSWCWARLEDTVLLVVDCHNKTAPYESHGIPLVRTSNIRDGQFVWDDLRFVSQATYRYWSKRCVPESGDIVFTREAPMGEAAIIPKDKQICLGQRTMLIRTIESCTSAKFILTVLLDPKFKERAADMAVGTGVKHFRVGDVSELLIPLAPTAEQTEIVRRVEQLFAFTDQLEGKIKTAQARVNHLTQSILAKAFSGELVPQDPNDEPASELLERIKAQRAAAPKAKRCRKSA
jgi:type I restriction enzyme S subunit